MTFINKKDCYGSNFISLPNLMSVFKFLSLFFLLFGFLINFLGCQSVSRRNTSPPATSTSGKKGASAVKGSSGTNVTSPTAAPAKGATAVVKNNTPLSQPSGSQTPTANAEALEKSGSFLAALKEYHTLYMNSDQQINQETYRQKSLDLVFTKLDEEELLKVSESTEFGYLRAVAMYELGQTQQERNSLDQARSSYQAALALSPGSDWALRSEQALLQLDRSRFVSSQTIGAILPLSGKSASIGQKALRGIQLGLRLHEPAASFKLAVIDSEGNADVARRGVERLVNEDNVIAIVGSLLSRTASAVSARAAEFEVPVLGLSQKTGITETSPTTFRNALTAEMLVRQLVKTAMDDLGMKRFAIFAPNDSYGIEYSNLFWDEVMARGGTIVAAQIYDPKKNDLRDEAQRLVHSWYVEDRQEEFRIRQKQVSTNTKKPSRRSEKSTDDLLPALVDFDAVFIPDSIKKMNTAAAFLSYAGVRDVKLLGTNLWNSSSAGKQAGLFADKIIFVDSWASDDPRLERNRFFSEFKKVYGEAPGLIELQAYDSAVILRSIILQGAGSREAITRQLTDLKNFPGAVGYLNMSSQREILRPLSAYTLNGNEIVPVKAKR